MNRCLPRFFALAFTFLASLSVAFTAHAGDVKMYGVAKSQHFHQDNPIVVVLIDPHNDKDKTTFEFDAFIDTSVSGTATGATLALPAAANSTNRVLDASQGSPEYQDSFDSKLAMDTPYPAGAYVLDFDTQNDGHKHITLTLPAESYPNVPIINNYAALQTAIPTASITVQFGGASGATIVQFEVRDSQGNGIFKDKNLTSSSTSTTIPANTLAAGQTYTGRLFYAKGATDTASYSGATGVAVYIKQTEFSITTTGGTDTSAPRAVQSIPNNDSNVPVNSVVAFYFSEPMQTGVSVSWVNVTGANFTYTWSTDKMVLFCKYSSSLPNNTVVNWTLNKAGFHDLAGNALQADFSGSFTTSGQSASSLDVTAVYISKGKSAVQTSTSAAVADGGYGFSLYVPFTGENTVTNYSLTWSAGTVTGGPDDSDGTQTAANANQISANASYASQTDLDQFFPNTTYTVVLNAANNGTKTLNNFSISGNNYPSFPHVSNFTAAQAVNPTNDFTLTWDSFGGVATDGIIIEIDDQYGSQVLSVPFGQLDGTKTQYAIANHTLGPGRTYTATLRFYKTTAVSTTSTYANVAAGTAYSSETHFSIVTTGQPIAPRMESLGFSANHYQLRVKGQRQLPYTIEYTDNFQFWTEITSMNASSTVASNAFFGSFDTTDNGSLAAMRFYRAREGFSNNNNNGSGTYYSVLFDPSLNVTSCNGGNSQSYSSQSVSADGNGNFSTAWEPGSPLVNVNGSVNPSAFSASITCISGGNLASLSATSSGPYYVGNYGSGRFYVTTMNDNVYIQGRVVSNGTPVSNATVSTSLDSATTTTDSGGYFFLVTATGNVANYTNTPYTITIKQGSTTVFQQTIAWGGHPTQQLFNVGS